MFGIAIANAEQLSEQEKERYRSFYCGVCHALKRDYGQVSRAALTYDLAFLAIVLNSIFEPEEAMKSSRCIVHPRTVHTYVEGGFVDYAAAMTVALAFHKCLDDWVDDGKVTSVSYSLALKRAYSRVRRQYPAQCKAIEQHLKAISAIEQYAMERYRGAETEEARAAAFDQVDAAAQHFGAIMAAVFSAQPYTWQDELETFSMHFGRFIYFADAAYDQEEDAKHGAFNPFAYRGVSDEDISALLFSIIGQATEAFEKLPLEQDLHLMRSVLYSGVWQKLSLQARKKEQEQAKKEAALAKPQKDTTE